MHLKTDKVDLKKKPPWKKIFLHIFSIHSSSRYEKRCRMLQRLFWLFQCSKNQLWIGSTTRPLAILIEGGLLEALSTSSKENRKIFHLWGDLLYQFYTDCRVRRYRLSKYGQFIEIVGKQFSIYWGLNQWCLSLRLIWVGLKSVDSSFV